MTPTPDELVHRVKCALAEAGYPHVEVWVEGTRVSGSGLLEVVERDGQREAVGQGSLL